MKNLAFDFETSPIPRHYPWVQGSYASTLALANESNQWFFVITHNESEPEIDISHKIYEIICNHDRLIGHYLKFDYTWLEWLLREHSSILLDKLLYCTAEAEYMIRGQDYKQSYSLDATSKRYGLIRKIDQVRPFWDSGYNTKEIPLRILRPYVEQDTYNALAIYQKQVPLIKRIKLQRELTVQMEKVRVLAELEKNGMKFDKDYVSKVVENRRNKLELIDWELTDSFGWRVNLQSKDELSLALYGGARDEKETIQIPKKSGKGTKSKVIWTNKVYKGIGIRPIKGTEQKKEGYYKTNKATIKQLTPKNKTQKKVLENLLSRSKISKELNTFIGDKEDTGLLTKLHDGFLHPSYNNTVTTTGRLSSSNPNGQNLSKVIKRAIIPRFDVIGDVDLSQLEWRCAAFMSQCPVMMDEILSGADQHNIIAEKYFNNDRKPAKIFNFRMIYGGSWYSYYADPAMPAFSMRKWQDIVNGFYEHYYGLRKWHDKIIAYVQANGFLQIPTGRWYRFHKDDPKTGNYRDQKIKNYPVQGLATADIAPLALVLIAKQMRERRFRSKIIGAVHDSITFDLVSKEIESIRDLSLNVLINLPKYIQQVYGFEFNLPLSGDFKLGPNWGEVAEDYNYKEAA